MFKKKSALTSKKLAQRKRRIFLLKISGIIAVIFLFIFGIIKVSRFYALMITSVSVHSNTVIDTNSIQQIATQDIRSNYLFFFPKANRLLYPRKKILTDILGLSPRIETTDMSVHGNELVITITERTPAYTWCAGMPVASSVSLGQACYFIDSHGFIFSEAPIFSGNVFFAFYGLIATNTAPIGSTYLNSTDFEFVNKIISYLDSVHIHTYALFAEADGVYNLYLNQGSKIIFKQDQDPSSIISNLDVIMKNTTVFSTTSTSTLQYVDLRFGNKIFYKYNNK